MSDKNAKHIAFYTKKVALFGNRKTRRGKNKYRAQRLRNYKNALNKRLSEQKSEGLFR